MIFQNRWKNINLVHANRVHKGFITGPSNLDDLDVSKLNIPFVYIGSKDPLEQYNLILYQLQEITCMFLIKTSKASIDVSFWKNLDSFIGHQIDILPPIQEDHYLKKQGGEEQYRYIYFNHMNFALKTSLKEKGAAVPRETMKMLNEIHSDFEKSPENISEVLIRTQNDRWIVGRKSDQREFYVIFDHKNSHLIEINEEVRKLSTTYFGNIFID